MKKNDLIISNLFCYNKFGDIMGELDLLIEKYINNINLLMRHRTSNKVLFNLKSELSSLFMAMDLSDTTIKLSDRVLFNLEKGNDDIIDDRIKDKFVESFYDVYDWVIKDKIESILWIWEKLFNGAIFYQYQEDYTIQDKDKSKYLRRYATSSVRLAKNKINPLIQCYKALFYELEEEELQKNMSEFLDFVWQDKYKYK